MCTKAAIAVAFALCLLAPTLCVAQVASGTIAGRVRDASGGAVQGATVRTISRATGEVRVTTTEHEGQYSLPALQPGDYLIHVEANGFVRMIAEAIVHGGVTTRADVTMRIGSVRDSVTVQAAVPQLRYDSAAIGGIVTRDQIDGLPLNGRSFLELAKLEPGVHPPTAGNRNRTVVPMLGGQAANVGGTRFTVDGGSVTAVGLGGSQIGLSLEAVQEFQISTVNFDLSSGMTDTGTVNVVTRAGGNELRATSFFFLRDHHLAAYPVLERYPANPDPVFRRSQFGVAAGGPVRRNRMFLFGTWERNVQRAVIATTLRTPEFAHLSRLTTSPLSGDLLNVRFDARLARDHTLFARHSHDGSRAFGPAATIGGGSETAYPSNWNRVVTGADQSLVTLTSVLRPTLVNDLRVSSFVVQSDIGGPGDQDCAGCVGRGAPAISIPQAGLLIGSSTAVDYFGRRFHLSDSLTWQRARHRVRVGAHWEHLRERNLIWNHQPVSITLFAPDRIRAHNAQVDAAARIPLPDAFRTIDDILRLPVQAVLVGIGDAGVPQDDGGPLRSWNTFWMYGEDVWRLHDRVTLTYGLGWGFDGLSNDDLQKPALLAPVLGGDGLGPRRANWANFSPVAGIVWTPSFDRRTVIRAGAGRFYRPHGLTSSLDAERVALGPPGVGRQNFSGTAIVNWVPGVPGLPIGAPLDFRAPTAFTATDLMAILPAIRAGLDQSLTNGDRSLQQIQITKHQALPAIFPATVPNPSAVHVNLGAQRELARHLVLSADLVYRHFVHVPQGGGSFDANHFNSVRGPLVRRCTTAEAADPRAQCSLGPIHVQKAPFRFQYKGLVVRADKRLSHGAHVLASYAYSRSSGTNTTNGFDLENWLQNRGPTGNDLTHVLNVAAGWRLPLSLDLGLIFSYASAPPFSAFVGGADFNGDGTTGDLLPGTTVNAFNRGLGRKDLNRLVAAFNERLAGANDAQGATIPRVTLPAAYRLNDDAQSLDVRLSRAVVIRSRVRLLLIVEAFNLYNAANLSGFSGDLTSAAFGQPAGRTTQVFGSGGPRSFQVAARITY